MDSITIVDCIHFLCSPRVKARLNEYLVHLKLYEARLRELKDKIKDLKNARDTVQHKIDEQGKRYGSGVPKEVADWIKSVDTTISEFDEFDKDDDHQLAVFNLLTGYLPKTGIRLRLSREALTITREVNKLLQTAKHDTYSYWLGPPSLASFFHTVGYDSFPSREESIKNIKEALKSPNVRVVGLHGLSGVGKTTLVKKIARDVLQASEADKIFDVVVMSSLTRNPDIRQIQGHIADALGMKLDEESDMARAARIQNRLKNESTLIILDDLWATLDLNLLGIPLDVDDQNSWTELVKENSFGNLNEGKPAGEHSQTKPEGNSGVIDAMKSKKLQSTSNMKTEETLRHYKGCKVLLISESKQMLLNQMGEEENSIYFIKVLMEKEAEAFFKKMAGIGNGKTEFDKLMMSIVNKCNGLPMSIVTTARALKDQSQSVWEDALCKLERGNFTGTSDFSTKLSYDLLEDEELKRAFLLCAGMGPDALIMDLMKYCLGLGFLQRVYTVKEARDRVCVLVGKLKESGLLSDSYSSDRFTMQDIVRSVALSITSEDRHVFTKTKEQIDEWPDKLERYAVISLHHCHIIEGFHTGINYPGLRFFQVNNNDPHLQIPKHFFEGMKKLRVLKLSGISLSLFDSSASSLTELRMLSLEQCMLPDKDLSDIGKLKKLRILSFSGSNIENLPVELNQLKKLQIFDISNCSKLTNIPSNVISSLISLEELYMRNTLIQWEVKEHNCQSKKASLSEFRHLYQLTTLDIHIPDADHFPKNLFFDKLSSYKIVIGDLNAYSDMDVKMPEIYEASRFLAIQLKKGDIHSQKGIKMLFERVENLFLEELNGVQDMFYRLNLKGFPYLKHLLIVNNSDIRSLINPEDRKHTEMAFPKLESLHLYNLKNMAKICSCKQGCQARDLNRNIVRSHAFSTTDRAGALQRSPESPDR